MAQNPWAGATYVLLGERWLPNAIVVEPSGQIRWWDGSVLQDGEVLGWWDGTQVQPVELLGWWDGAAVQPLATT